MDFGSPGLVKEFTETESRMEQRFIRMLLKKNRMVGSYAKEHSVLRQD
jgi:hypothetical protein